MTDNNARPQQSAEELLTRVRGAIAAGIRGAVSCEGTAIRYHEHRATPDLDWVYGQAEGIAEYVTTSFPWNDLREHLGLARGDA